MKNKAQTITARQGNRIMILEIFSAAAMFLPQIALKKSYHSGIIVVIIASVMTGIYLCITDCVAQGISIENILKKYRLAAIIYYVSFFPREPTVLTNTPRKRSVSPANDLKWIAPSFISPR